MVKNMILTILLKNALASKLVAGYLLLWQGTYLNRVGWFESFRQGMPCEENKHALPWFTYSAIAFLEERINSRMIVFEYGSGNSTIWWSRCVSKVVSCEHNNKWHLRMKSKPANNVEYLCLALEPGGDYSKAILKYEDTFDIVVIDGRDRVNCAKASLSALKSTGVVIWDNSDRKEYAEGFDFLEAKGFRRLDFWGMGPINVESWCTSGFYRINNCFGI